MAFHSIFFFFEVSDVRKESDFQHNLIEELEVLFPGCVIMKNDPNYIQGIPDLLILFHEKWAVLECKRSYEDYLKNKRPNQEYYITKLNDMSYASFIYPEIKEEVINELQQAFRPRRKTRVSKR